MWFWAVASSPPTWSTRAPPAAPEGQGRRLLPAWCVPLRLAGAYLGAAPAQLSVGCLLCSLASSRHLSGLHRLCRAALWIPSQHYHGEECKGAGGTVGAGSLADLMACNLESVDVVSAPWEYSACCSWSVGSRAASLVFTRRYCCRYPSDQV